MVFAGATCALPQRISNATNATGSAIRALIKRKKALSPDFLQPVFYRNFSNALRIPIRACVFVSKNRSCASSLARRGDPFSQPSGSSNVLSRCLPGPTFEPKGADRNSPALLPPARFSWSTASITTRVSLGKRARHQLCAHPEIIRGQKTFSAGPRSFNSKELWFTASIPAP